VLYFNHVKHAEFSSIRQQMWIVLHYPLHVAILLTAEGSRFLMLSRVTSRISSAWGNLHPLHDYPDWTTFFEGYLSPLEVVSDISEDIDTLFNMTFNPRTSLLSGHNYTQEFEGIKNIAQPFNSSQWQNDASERINQLWSGVDRAIYSAFGMDVLEPPDHGPSSTEEVAYQLDGMDAVFLCFYIAAISVLLILALMSFLPRSDHNQIPWLAIWIKIVVGIAFLVPISSNWVRSGSKEFLYSPWTPAVVLFGYFTGELHES
jgi:hypothetical protein